MAAEARNYLVQHAHGRHVRLKNTVIDSYGRVLANVILNDIRSWSSYMSWRIKGLFIRINALVTRRKGPIDAQPSSLGITFNEKKPGMRASIGGTGAAGPQGDDDPLLNRALVRYGLARFEHVKSEYAGSLRLAEETAKDRNLGIYSSACRSAIPPGACGIKGNIRQGIKRYYTSGCRQYNQVIVDLSYGDRWFCSGREAEDAGFTLSPSCK